MTLPDLRCLLTRYPNLTVQEANDMHKLCAKCGHLTLESQLIDVPSLGLCCLGCDCEATLKALSEFGVDCDELVREFDRVVL